MAAARVLIVEDESIIAMEIRSTLLKLGYQVVDNVSTGQKAVTAVVENPPDIILMDIRLSGDMDGIEAADRIQQEHNIPIIFMTAYAEDEKLERAKLLMPFGYLLKPVQGRDLRVALEMGLYLSEIDSKRREAERKLRNSEKRYRTLLQAAPYGIQLTDPEGKIIYSNPAHHRIQDCADGELIGRSVFELPDGEEEQDLLRQFYQKIIKDEPTPQSFFNRDRTKKGRIIEVQIDWDYIRNTDNQIEGIISIVSDITETKQAQMALEEKEERYRQLFQQMSSGVAVYRAVGGGEDFVFVDFNRAAETIEQIEKSRVLGKKVTVVFPGVEAFGLLDVFKRVYRTGIPESHPVSQYVDGRISGWRENYVYKLPSEEIVALYDDKTAEKQAEERIEQSQKKFQDLYDTSPNMYFSIALHTNTIQECNQTLVDKLGCSKSDLIGKNVSVLFTPESAAILFDTCLPRLIQSQEVKETDLSLRSRDGSEIVVNMHLIAVKDGNDTVKIGRASLHDISERKSLEEQRKELERRLRQTQKMEAIGTLAGGIAHDFNNILQPIMGFSTIALRNLDPSDKNHQYITSILTAAKRAKGLVSQILAFSRKSSRELRPVLVPPIIKEALKLLRSSIPTTIEIQQQIDEDCGLIMADFTEIHQIIMNLATNAFHAMQDEGGRLGISLQQVKLTAEDLKETDLNPGEYLCLQVSDTGHGMSPEIQEKIFDPYFTTKEKEKGTGLGLSVIMGIVQSCGGTISVESRLGEGSTFAVFLPVAEIESTPILEESPQINFKGTARVLLVDDEAAIVEMEKEMLQYLGYQVTERTSSIEALKVFETDPAAFDIVITDMTMPNMTGSELTRRLLAIRPDLPVIICTGFSELINDEKAQALGIRKLLMKPITSHQFAEAIEEALN